MFAEIVLHTLPEASWFSPCFLFGSRTCGSLSWPRGWHPEEGHRGQPAEWGSSSFWVRCFKRQGSQPWPLQVTRIPSGQLLFQLLLPQIVGYQLGKVAGKKCLLGLPWFRSVPFHGKGRLFCQLTSAPRNLSHSFSSNQVRIR